MFVPVDAVLPTTSPNLSWLTINENCGIGAGLDKCCEIWVNTASITLEPPPNILFAVGEFNGIIASALPPSPTFTNVPPGTAGAIPPSNNCGIAASVPERIEPIAPTPIPINAPNPKSAAPPVNNPVNVIPSAKAIDKPLTNDCDNLLLSDCNIEIHLDKSKLVDIFIVA